MSLYRIYNGPSPTTAAQAPVATGTAIKTLLQVLMGATQQGRVVEWGISFDGFVAAEPVICELIETDDDAATVTAHVALGIVKMDAQAMGSGDPTTDKFQVGTSATGYTASSEGTPAAAARVFDAQLIAPTNQYVKQWPLGREPVIGAAKILRVRVTAPDDVNAICYVDIEV